ncbi:Nif3-like dinuclear metal center hexameric protein [Marichromatium bheemlicum]|uniref:Nif3-like dinuclear metal center hexameric protein n=1 Tax=Marichromatium bheemlicum TaxID=365339 RepID=A0ABX1I8K2_9GAMM|nr:Nif3-like dinuclear metal center hexameric protein [Marichromatium bheemlicum]NKN33890.1 Nif3-like dinuclear metal center hexameric protein [Marichromatium bheemlicum]
MCKPRELVAFCDQLLDASAFADYCPNGLQVEGEREIELLVSGVTASAALIEAACDLGADAILVHHGWFWKNEPPCLTGIKARRARTLLKAGMSLIAYHLPLDAHAEVGNNATLGNELGFLEASPTAAGGLLWSGRLAAPLAPEAVAARVAERLGRAPLLVGETARQVTRVAWCSGGGQGHIELAAELGVDLFLSGEISEQTTHLARELGLSYLAAGHHATERYGVQALGERVAAHLGLRHQFVEIANPA